MDHLRTFLRNIEEERNIRVLRVKKDGEEKTKETKIIYFKLDIPRGPDEEYREIMNKKDWIKECDLAVNEYKKEII